MSYLLILVLFTCMCTYQVFGSYRTDYTVIIRKEALADFRKVLSDSNLFENTTISRQTEVGSIMVAELSLTPAEAILMKYHGVVVEISPTVKVHGDPRVVSSLRKRDTDKNDEKDDNKEDSKDNDNDKAPKSPQAALPRPAVATTCATQNERGMPWHLSRIASGIQFQRDHPFHYSPSWGAGVVVYVLDSGVYEHDELKGRVEYGPSYVVDGVTAQDCSGHGTAVASLIAGKTLGIARSAKIVSIRVIDCRIGGNSGMVVDGIGWAIRDAAARRVRPIINMSLTSGKSPALDRVIDEAVKLGAVMIAAAGNQGSDACGVSPASNENVISVGSMSSSDTGDNRSAFSNFGPCVDIFAPGEKIRTAVTNTSSGYDETSGTSVAAPLVAGAVAQILSSRPDATIEEIKDTILSFLSVRAPLELNCSPLKTPKDRVQCRKSPSYVLQTGCYNGQIVPSWNSSSSSGLHAGAISSLVLTLFLSLLV